MASNGKLNRVALVRLDALGDTLLTTPAIQILQQEVPDCEILALTHPIGTQALQHLVQVQEVRPEVPWRELARLLREYRPDAVLCCSEKRRAALATWASGAPMRVGFDPGMTQPLKSLAGRLFFHRTVPFANDRHRQLGMHETQRYVRLVELLLGRSGFDVPAMVLAGAIPEARVPAPVGVQLVHKWCRFGYTVQHFRQWVQALGEVVGLAAPEDEDWARRHFPDVPLLVSPNLREYAGWLKQLQAFVTIDTGSAHVAAAAQVPVVDVFHNPYHEHILERWRPWRCPNRVFVLPPFSPDAVTEVGSGIRRLVDELRAEQATV